MSEITLNGRPVVRATLWLPASGVWSASVDVDTAEELSGAVSLAASSGAAWAASVARGAVSHGLWSGLIVGGAGGLRAPVAPLAYRNATLADVVRDVLESAGERLSSTSDSLSTAVALWHRRQGSAGSALASVAERAGYAWRVLRDGSVWLGVETWPDAGDLALTLLSRDPSLGTYALSGDTFGIAPGQSLQVQDEAGATFINVSSVRHVIEPERITTTVWQS